MSSDLLSYLVSSSSPTDIVRVGAARDLIAARVLAKKADQGSPEARAFVQGAQEALAQADIRRLRANRLRGGAAKASARGYHQLSKLGAEAAVEEENEALALEANVIGAVRATHTEDGFGYYSPEETRLLRRKAYEESLSASQREDVMNKLLSQLYTSSDTMGADDTDFSDALAYLGAASHAFGGDLDSVFGADCAERMGAVAAASEIAARKEIRALRAKIQSTKPGPARARMRAAIQILRAKAKAIQSGSKSVWRAEDARVGVDEGEVALFDQLTDYGAEERVAVMSTKLKNLSTKKVKAIANDTLRKKEVREAARAELSRREEEGDEEAVDPKAKRLRAMQEKFKALPEARLRAISKDSLRRLDVRAAAKAELARRAGSSPDADSEDAAPDTESASSDTEGVATAPKAYNEEEYLKSYNGVTPARRRFVRHFQNRAATLGADSQAMLAYAVRSEDAFGGFFQSLGEFFRNLFSTGARDTKRMSQAGKAAAAARKAEREARYVKERRLSLSMMRLQRTQEKRNKASDPATIAQLDKSIREQREKLRDDRSKVRAAGKAAYEKEFESSSWKMVPSKSTASPVVIFAPVAEARTAASAFPLTGALYLKQGMKDANLRGGTVPNGEILLLQQLLNQNESAGIPEDGNFGDKTHKAVVAFQKKVGDLKRQGVVGPDTAAKMAVKWGY